MNKAFRRILNLVRRTGDRMVVTDPEGEEAFVVMDLDQYEGLVDLEESYFAHMQGEDGDEFFGGEPDEPPPEPLDPEGTEAVPETETPTARSSDARIWDVMAPAGADADTWDYEKLSPEERETFESAFEAAAVRDLEPQAKPELVKTEPKIEEKSASDEEFGEEQFYLEPIE